MIKRIFTILIAAFIFNNCATGPVHGLLFNSTKFAGEVNMAIEVQSIKKAEGCSHAILGLFAFGENAAGSLAFKNGIKKIASIEHSSMSVLTFVYRNYCTIISGE